MSNGGATLRPSETVGMFAPADSALVGVPHDGLAARPEAYRAADEERGRARGPASTDSDRPHPLAGFLPGAGGPFGEAQGGRAPRPAPTCEASAGVADLTNFAALVARTREGQTPIRPEMRSDPCYGGGIAGTGDVDGPGTATDNALARFDGTSGKVIQNSGVVLGDDDQIIGPAAISMVEQSAEFPVAAGQGQFWVKDDGGDPGQPTTPRFTDDLGGTGALMLGHNNLSEIPVPATARSNLGLVIGTNVEAWDADLDAVAALGGTGFAVRTAANTWAQRAVKSADARISIKNGTGVAGDMEFRLDFSGHNKVRLTNEVTGTLPIANGGTGATNAAGALANLGTLKATVVAWTGSGSSGKTVTLTGINRAYYMRFFNDAGYGPNTLLPAGATGSIRRIFDPSGASDTTISLNAPSAGTAQVMTINNNYGDDNTNGQAYHALVIGTST